MKKFTCLVLCILSLSLIIGSASALWENMTPSAWDSYEDAFKTPELTPSSWTSYEDAFKIPELTQAWSYYNENVFKVPWE